MVFNSTSGYLGSMQYDEWSWIGPTGQGCNPDTMAHGYFIKLEKPTETANNNSPMCYSNSTWPTVPIVEKLCIPIPSFWPYGTVHV